MNEPKIINHSQAKLPGVAGEDARAVLNELIELIHG